MRKVVIILLSLILVAGCSKPEKKRIKLPTKVKVEVVDGERCNGAQQYVGIVEEQAATAVSFTSRGILKRVLVSEGERVSRGQLLAEIDDTQARNLLAGAEAAMTQANDALERYGMLHDNGSLPEVQWVEIQSKVAQAASQLAVARKNLSDCRLTAPVSGVIGEKLKNVGETARPTEAIVTILDVSKVKVKVAVPEGEMNALNNQTLSTVKVNAINATFEGGEIEKGVKADALTHSYDVRITVDNSQQRLLPGMVAAVTFEQQTSSQGTQVNVPVTAVQRRADGSLFVWTVDENRTAHRTAVTVGETLGNRITLTSGIVAGTTVVTEGYQKLSEGTTVVY